MNYEEIMDKVVRPRAVHQCAWCGEKIVARERCQYRVYIFDGELTRDWMHEECYIAMLKSDHAYISDDGFCPGEFKRGEVAQSNEVTHIPPHYKGLNT